MLSNKVNNQIVMIAYATVSNLFASFHNEKNRGSNFSWDKFPTIAASHVRTQVFMSVPLSDEKKHKEAMDHGQALGLEIAVNMVKLMTE